MLVHREISSFFHRLPRANFRFRFHYYNSDGFSGQYIQSLVIWGSLPLLVCVVLLAVVIVAWSSRCCSPKSKVPKRHLKSSSPSLHCLLFTVVLSCILVFACLLANEVVDRGFSNASMVLKMLKFRTENSIKKIQIINRTLFSDVADNLEQLKTGLLGLRSFQQKYLGADNWVLRATEIEQEIINASNNLDSVSVAARDFTRFFDDAEKLDQYEFERRILFGSLLTIIFVVMLSAITAAATHSKRGLVLFGASAIFVFIICWCIVAAVLVLNIVLADLCSKPVTFFLPFFYQNISRDYITERFYVASSNVSFAAVNPLREALDQLQMSVEQVPAIINGVSCLLGQQNAGETSVSIIDVLSACQRVQRSFYDVLRDLGGLYDFFSDSLRQQELQIIDHNVCFLTTISAAALLLCSLLYSFTLFLILLLLNRAWRLLDTCSTGTGASAAVGFAGGARRCLINGGADDSSLSNNGEVLAACGAVYERGDPFFVTGAENDNIPAEFYGSHVSNPRTRQRGQAGDEHHAVGEISESAVLWRSTPPPAYECVPLMRSQVRQQRL